MAAKVHEMSQHRRQIPAKLFQEYLENVAQAHEPQASEIRHSELLRSYAELQFRLNGNARCAICNATVRHKVPITVERPDGRVDHYECLCTRCFEGEKAQSVRIIQQLGEARVEQEPKPPVLKATDFRKKKHVSKTRAS
ncbi:MAG: hypothetical protein HYX26_03880 [Acidobacteriales bacterium]|nr:hypothetical protein [Terriglobales bacterium]